MRILDSIESSILFRLTRVLSLLIVSAAALGVMGAALVYVRLALPASTAVSTSEIRELMQAEPEASLVPPVVQRRPSAEVAITLQIERLLDELPRNDVDINMMREQVNSWRRELPVDTQLEFITEMRAAVQHFPDHDKARACFAFVRAKAPKLWIDQLRKESLAENQWRILGIIGACLALIAVSSLVLVLLRIERNTRPPRNQVQVTSV